MSEEPIAKGELWKKSDDEGKYWKKRFIKLYPSHLTYAVNEFSEVLGEMHFTEEFFVQDSTAPNGKFGFIVTDFNTVHRLAAEAKDVKEFWCHTITTCIREKLESAHYFEETRKLVKKADEDVADKADEARLENYYKAVNRPKARQNRKSFVDFRAAQVFAEAQEAVKEAETAEATDKDKLEKEARRLSLMAKSLQEQVEKEEPPTSVVVLSGIKEEDEEAPPAEEPKKDDDKFRPVSTKIPELRAKEIETAVTPQQPTSTPAAAPAKETPAPPAAAPALAEPAAVESPAQGGIAAKVGAWNQKMESEKEKQSNNVFSGSYQGGKKPIDKDAYGKAPEGSKTEERAKQASEWVDREIDKLISVICEMGAHDPAEGGIKTVEFGPLFYAYADISDTLVGILMRAKKRKRLFYPGDMLFQNRHDHVKITVLKE